MIPAAGYFDDQALCTRYILALWGGRRGLRTAFADPYGTDSRFPVLSDADREWAVPNSDIVRCRWVPLAEALKHSVGPLSKPKIKSLRTLLDRVANPGRQR